MEQMTVTSLTALFPETKSEIKTFAERMVASVVDGYTDPLKVKVQLSAMKKTIEEIESSEEFKNAVINEAERYHKEELKDLHNAKIEIKEVGVKYDYSKCGMTEYDILIGQISELTERKKALEKGCKLSKEKKIIFVRLQAK